ncbi:MAG: peptide chain release factor N(5)-glutamine methyltransferase [Streptococcaceae bacterium]|jgi:release factor glutamine methyltransferase|nr:peptide chain release factor N(5)-glutamine methyltransferase [Streptococcaceae bacterium]
MVEYKHSIEKAVSDSESRLSKQGIENGNARFVFMGRKSWTLTEWVRHKGDEISKNEADQLLEDEELLAKHVPPQYILGFAEFLDEKFKVTSDTLIPRPETEELVMHALTLGKKEAPQNVVDIGTGSGAIAISIKKHRPLWHVWASDISIPALRVAKENAERLNAEVHFDLGDVLKPFMEQTRDFDDFEMFDLILSNPPYISRAEEKLMDESVKRYEPDLALFAEEEGLAVYKKIAEQSPFVLKQSGEMLLEIGFDQAKAVKKMFEFAFPTREVVVVKDMAGSDRMIWVKAIESLEEL